mmetsp:Transcript_66043/g.123186  ORF Transcript_66043/g.123186 Transcript_66043/m.123186 type:complete len:101 (+) Transcript_66043:480-782(+)
MVSTFEFVGTIIPPPPPFGVAGGIPRPLLILGVRALGGLKPVVPVGDVGSSNRFEFFFGLVGLPPFGVVGEAPEPSDAAAPIGVVGGDVELVPVPSLPFP